VVVASSTVSFSEIVPSALLTEISRVGSVVAESAFFSSHPTSVAAITPSTTNAIARAPHVSALSGPAIHHSLIRRPPRVPCEPNLSLSCRAPCTQPNLINGRTWSMKLRALLPLAAVAALLFAACGSGRENATPTARPSEAASPSAAIDPGSATGAVQNGKTLTAAGGKLEVSSQGSAPLDLTVRELQKEPGALPQGWQLVMPAVEITAAGESGPVTTLKDPLALRFRTTESLATVLSFDGKRWQMVPTNSMRYLRIRRPPSTPSQARSPGACNRQDPRPNRSLPPRRP
jgi:hypothetical protein